MPIQGHLVPQMESVMYKGTGKGAFGSGHATYPFFFHSQVDQFFKNTRHFHLLWIVGGKPAKPKKTESGFNLNNDAEVS